MASLDLIRTTAAATPSSGAQLLDTVHLLDAARANLKDALREEGEALAGACAAVKTSGPASAKAAGALRSAQTAHSRSTAAAGEVRALNTQADRDDAAARGPNASVSPSAYS